MRRISKVALATALVAAATLAIAGCPGGVPGKPGIPGRTSGVDPNTCGNYAASNAGKKLKKFFQATIALDKAVKDTEDYVRKSCAMMGAELGISAGDLEGKTKKVCNKVIASLNDHMKLGIKAESKLDIQYQPAVCTVDFDARAQVAARCEAKATADIGVKCEGKCGGTCSGECSGTCSGTCNGTCEGSAGTGGSGGQCDGVCKGTCEGSCSATCSGTCSGGCEGHADIDASAECRADAEVSVNLDAKCTEPKLDINYDAGIVLDESQLKAAIAAIKAGLPQLLMVQAKVKGPLKSAVSVWAKSAEELAGSANKLAKSFDDQAICVAGQISAAFAMLASIQVSIEVQVDVSASASGSAGI